MFEVSTTSFHTDVDERRLVAERAKFAKHVMVSVGVCFSEKGNCISFQTRPKWMLNFMLKPCCQNLFNIADLFCNLASYFNSTARLHARQSWLKTDCYQLQWIHWYRWMASELVWPQTSGIPCLGSYAWTLLVISTQAGDHRWSQESSAVDIGPAATGLDQQSHFSFPKRFFSSLCESWWWTLRTYTKMKYLSDFGICNNSQCFLTIKITSCCWLFRAKIENMAHNIYIAITLEKTNNSKKVRIVAWSLPYKSRNVCIKILHGCREIAFCPVEYFNLSHPIYMNDVVLGHG